MKPIGKSTTKATFAKAVKDSFTLPISDRAKILDTLTMTEILATSEG